MRARARFRAGGNRANGGEKHSVDGHLRLMERVAADQDDVLCTIQLVADDSALQARLFDQLVDLLVEGMFLEVRRSYLARELERADYVEQLGTLAERCREQGLLPFPSRHA